MWPRRQQLFAFALMISLGLIMFAEVREGPSQRGFTEQDQLGKALALDRANPTFRVTIQIGAAGRQGDAVFVSSKSHSSLPQRQTLARNGQPSPPSCVTLE